jgi:Tfp pilus assembly protein PilN
MASRVGIELTSSRCTIVEVEAPKRGKMGGIRAFRSISYDPADPAGFVAALRQLLSSKTFSTSARVAIWGLRSGHQSMSLPPASEADLQDLALREARRSMPFIAEGEVASGIAVETGGRYDVKREVSFAAASVADVRERLQPLVSAGIQVEAVLTPPLALASLARLQTGPSEAVDAYLSVNRDASCLAIIRNGLLVFSREIPIAAGPDRIAFVSRLGSELRRSFLLFKQNSRLVVGRVFVCGDYPELRSLTAPLIGVLDTEVETLDSLEGLTDAASDVPDGAAELRLAWAIAADDPLPVNLLPAEARAQHSAREARSRLLGATAVVLLFLGLLYAGARIFASSGERRVTALRQQIATLEPQARDIEQARQARVQAQARRTALDAFSVQGPRLARVLEILAQSAPQNREVVLNSVVFSADGALWRVTLKGEATGPNPGIAQNTFNQFFRQLSASPFLGQVVGSPALRVSTETGDTPARGGGRQAGGTTATPQGFVAWDNVTDANAGTPGTPPPPGTSAPGGVPVYGSPARVRERDLKDDIIANRRLWDFPYTSPYERPLEARTTWRWPQARPALPVTSTEGPPPARPVAESRLEFTVVFEVRR